MDDLEEIEKQINKKKMEMNVFDKPKQNAMIELKPVDEKKRTD